MGIQSDIERFSKGWASGWYSNFIASYCTEPITIVILVLLSSNNFL